MESHSFMPINKYRFHCIDFHKNNNYPLNVCGYLLYQNLSKSDAKWEKYGQTFIYALNLKYDFYCTDFH
jgi:hypothetical protein